VASLDPLTPPLREKRTLLVSKPSVWSCGSPKKLASTAGFESAAFGLGTRSYGPRRWLACPESRIIPTMPVDEPRRPLLGRLAGLGWFSRHGEVAATQSLAILLEDPELRAPLLSYLGERAQTDPGPVESFQAESGVDGGRSDLEGQDVGGRPLLVVEAKFGATLSDGQVRTYLTDQEKRLDGGARGTLVLLVPSYRVPEAEAILRSIEEAAEDQGSVSTVVVTWEEWLGAWDVAAQELPGSLQDAVLSDLGQLRALCKTMEGVDVPPLVEVATGGDWGDREDDLHRLVREVTDQPQFRGPGRLLPTKRDQELDYYFRYIPGVPSDSKSECYCSVGVASRLRSAGGTPFWLRYHRKTRDFQTVSERIMASRYARDAAGNQGHIWLPLHVSPDRSGAAVLEELTAEIEEIRAIAAGSEAS
jgi:hypothetical protein